ncbi:hypothetical protein ACOSQ3_010727 [Xanthoceras sorbifolium]
MQGEFLALKEGLVLAKSLNLVVLVAKVDASHVASAMNSSISCCGDASFVVSDIQALCSEVGNCLCLAIPRSGNRLAYVLASLAFSWNVILNKFVQLENFKKKSLDSTSIVI